MTHLSPTATITLTTTFTAFPKKGAPYGKRTDCSCRTDYKHYSGKNGRSQPGRFLPAKPKFPFDKPYEQPFPRATPESQGISSDMLADLLRELDTSHYTDMHHFMVLPKWKGRLRGQFRPLPQPDLARDPFHVQKASPAWQLVFWLRKASFPWMRTFTTFFQKKLNTFNKIFRPKVTVENLLTMTSGVTFNESGIVSGNDWLTSYLNSSISGTPGENFQYNSLNTYVLSAIVTERTGQSLTEYLEPRLFDPLGITRYFWEICPKGHYQRWLGTFPLHRRHGKIRSALSTER